MVVAAAGLLHSCALAQDEGGKGSQLDYDGKLRFYFYVLRGALKPPCQYTLSQKKRCIELYQICRTGKICEGGIFVIVVCGFPIHLPIVF